MVDITRTLRFLLFLFPLGLAHSCATEDPPSLVSDEYVIKLDAKEVLAHDTYSDMDVVNIANLLIRDADSGNEQNKVLKVYNNVFMGFSARLSPKTVNTLKQNPVVEKIEENKQGEFF